MNWLEDHLAECTLTEEVEGYLLGRGAKESMIAEEHIVTWKPLAVSSPDESFRKTCGDLGSRLTGFLVCPVRSPKGTLLGFESRNIHRKVIVDFRFPESKWCPFWVGLQAGMSKIWAGGDVWIVEGLFDKCALEWAVPEKDAVLASVRAHLGKDHIEFLRRYCQGWVHMVYDNDVTGQQATHGKIDEFGKKIPGALARLSKVGIRCRDVPYSGKDPGVIWDRGGAAAIKTAFI